MTETQVAKLVWGIFSIVMLGIYTFEGIPILLIPALWGFITLSIAWLLYRRDKKKASKRPPLPCEGHKGTWSNPKYFSEDDLNSKE